MNINLDGSGPLIDGTPVSKMLVADLRKHLRRFQLVGEGKKAELRMRLTEHLKTVIVDLDKGRVVWSLRNDRWCEGKLTSIDADTSGMSLYHVKYSETDSADLSLDDFHSGEHVLKNPLEKDQNCEGGSEDGDGDGIESGSNSESESGGEGVIESEGESEGVDINFKVGDRVYCKWMGIENNGEWYYGEIISINELKETCHVLYDDGDHDKLLSWSNMRIV